MSIIYERRPAKLSIIEVWSEDIPADTPWPESGRRHRLFHYNTFSGLQPWRRLYKERKKSKTGNRRLSEKQRLGL